MREGIHTRRVLRNEEREDGDRKNRQSEFHIGQDLVTDTGQKNSERTVLEVQLISEGTPYPVGQITNSGGDFINVILLDVSGIPGLPAVIDGLRLIDVSGTITPTKESLDIDGVRRLSHDPDIQTVATSWGWIKAQRR
jgi:hypothetical protein